MNKFMFGMLMVGACAVGSYQLNAASAESAERRAAESTLGHYRAGLEGKLVALDARLQELGILIFYANILRPELQENEAKCRGEILSVSAEIGNLDGLLAIKFAELAVSDVIARVRASGFPDSIKKAILIEQDIDPTFAGPVTFRRLSPEEMREPSADESDRVERISNIPTGESKYSTINSYLLAVVRKGDDQFMRERQIKKIMDGHGVSIEDQRLWFKFAYGVTFE